MNSRTDVCLTYSKMKSLSLSHHVNTPQKQGNISKHPTESNVTYSSYYSKPTKLAFLEFVIINGNKLQIVAKQMNLNTNLDLPLAYWIKTNVTRN